MRTWRIFTVKEIFEQIKNYKALILLLVLFLIGVMSPGLAKLTPEILKSVDVGFKIEIPDPTMLDAYQQFFKNMLQMGTVVVLLIFSNNITKEFGDGTAAMMFSKGLDRSSFVLAKVFTMYLYWTIGFVLSFLTMKFYTNFLFETVSVENLLFAMASIWLLMIFILTLITLMSCVFKEGLTPLITTAGILGVLLVLGSYPPIAKFSPLSLGGSNIELLMGTKSVTDVLPPVIVAIALILVMLSTALVIVKNKEF